MTRTHTGYRSFASSGLIVAAIWLSSCGTVLEVAPPAPSSTLAGPPAPTSPDEGSESVGSHSSGSGSSGTNAPGIAAVIEPDLDRYHVRVVGHPELSTPPGGTRAEGGTLRLPLIGAVEVDGRSSDAVEQDVQAALSKYVRYPVVTVSRGGEPPLPSTPAEGGE